MCAGFICFFLKSMPMIHYLQCCISVHEVGLHRTSVVLPSTGVTAPSRARRADSQSGAEKTDQFTDDLGHDTRRNTELLRWCRFICMTGWRELRLIVEEERTVGFALSVGQLQRRPSDMSFS